MRSPRGPSCGWPRPAKSGESTAPDLRRRGTFFFPGSKLRAILLNSTENSGDAQHVCMVEPMRRRRGAGKRKGFGKLEGAGRGWSVQGHSPCNVS